MYNNMKYQISLVFLMMSLECWQISQQKLFLANLDTRKAIVKHDREDVNDGREVVDDVGKDYQEYIEDYGPDCSRDNPDSVRTYLP